MKKFFDKIYIFSKLGLSFSLLACLIGVLYILYINYEKEKFISQDEKIFKQELTNNVNSNTMLINKIVGDIKLNEETLEEIKKNIKNISNKSESKEISNLKESLEIINKNFELLSDEIKNLQNDSMLESTNKNEVKKIITNDNIIEIIDLILIKYENNINFSKEIEYLTTIVNNDKIKNIEKLFVLSNKQFKGQKFIERTFDKEVNLYLKKTINKDSNSLFSKIILPYIEIAPTTENIVTSDIILNIKKIKLDIENRNFENAYKTLKTLKDHEEYFRISFLEINKYLNFKNELFKLK